MNRMPAFTPLPATLLDPLPPVVQRYLRMALPNGIPALNGVTLHQQGAMRLKEGSQRWLPFSAEERFGRNPPEFVWRARLRLAPLLTATARDEYLDGIGGLEARLWGVIPLVHPAPHRHLDEGALLRYLAEAVWFPPALLPDKRLQWRSVGQQCAVAVLRDGLTEARLTCHFNERGEMEKVEALRPYLSGDTFLSRGWCGLFSGWGEFCGMRIPRHGRVFWRLEKGDWEYWRGTIESLTCSE